MDNVFSGIDIIGVNSLPTLFIRGSLSDYIKYEHEGIIKNYFPQAEIKTIEGVGHWVHAEAPKELCNFLSSFLKKPCNFEDI
jgi:esterase